MKISSNSHLGLKNMVGLSYLFSVLLFTQTYKISRCCVSFIADGSEREVTQGYWRLRILHLSHDDLI